MIPFIFLFSVRAVPVSHRVGPHSFAMLDLFMNNFHANRGVPALGKSSSRLLLTLRRTPAMVAGGLLELAFLRSIRQRSIVKNMR